MEEYKKYQDFVELSISSAGQTVKENFTLDARFKNVKAIYISSNQLGLAYLRGIIGTVKIAGIEALPDDCPASVIIPSANVAPNSRYYKISPVDTSKDDRLEFSYTDDNTGPGTFTAYKVRLHLIGDER